MKRPSFLRALFEAVVVMSIYEVARAVGLRVPSVATYIVVVVLLHLVAYGFTREQDGSSAA